MWPSTCVARAFPHSIDRATLRSRPIIGLLLQDGTQCRDISARPHQDDNDQLQRTDHLVRAGIAAYASQTGRASAALSIPRRTTVRPETIPAPPPGCATRDMSGLGSATSPQREGDAVALVGFSRHRKCGPKKTPGRPHRGVLPHPLISTGFLAGPRTE